MYRLDNPLVVQGDRTVLLEVHAPRYEEARDALCRFAELEKSPEHVHTYRISPLSLWNAAAAGLKPEDVVATLAEFGEQKMQQILGVAQPAPTVARASTSKIHWTANLTFLVAIAVGGLLAAASNGQLELRFDLGPTHTRLFGSGWHEWLALLGGGVLVGFGTQMAGGCTSGHGLSGVARLVPASLVATAMFFATAVGTSFLLEALAK